MDNEFSRLASFFSFPFNSPVSPTDLVAAGFYYEGNRDEVICHKCSLKHHGWRKGDVPFALHAERSPKCPIVLGEGSTSIKDEESMSKKLDHLEVTPSFGACGGPQGPSNLNWERYPVQAECKSGGPSMYDPQTPNQEIPRQKDSNFSYTEATASVAAQPEIPSRTPNSNLDAATTIAEDKEPADVNNTAVTDTSSSDRNNISAASYANNITEASSRNTSTSPTTKKNSIEDDTPSTPSTPAVTPNDTFGNEDTVPVMEPLGMSETRPRFPEYAILANRMSSYKSWPNHLHQRPNDLAKSGLYYEGSRDYVRCFHCAGGLREWEEHDDPMIEHARWFPFCTFLRQLKGDRFIMDVQSGNISSQPQAAAPAEESSHVDLSKHPAVQSVMAMGYKKPLVFKAVSSLRNQKDKILNAENLLQVVWDLEEAGEVNVEDDDGDVDEGTSEDIKTKEQHSDPPCLDRTTSPEHEEGAPSKDIETLREENRELKEQKTCKVCLDEYASIVFLPCGHLVTCPMCASALRKCPVCRAYIRGTVKAIIS